MTMGSLTAHQLLYALSRTFLHSMWQGLILAILAGMVMLLTVRSRSVLRYNLLSTIFLIFLVVVLITFMLQLRPDLGFNDAGFPISTNDVVAPGSSVLQSGIAYAELCFAEWSHWIVGLWFFVLLLKSLRMFAGFKQLTRLRTQMTVAVTRDWTNKLDELAAMAGIKRKVFLLESALVDVPVVLGHFKSLILIPAGILTNLSPAVVEAVLLHELAHVKRHDYLMNIVQRIGEILLFFNPGLIWVSSLLHVERENCCDDLAILHTNDKSLFLQALICFKEHAMRAPAGAMGLFGTKHHLLQRMTRIVYSKNKGLTIYELMFFVAGTLLLAMFVITQNGENRVALPSPLYGVVAVKPDLPVQKSFVTSKADASQQSEKTHHQEVQPADTVVESRVSDAITETKNNIIEHKPASQPGLVTDVRLENQPLKYSPFAEDELIAAQESDQQAIETDQKALILQYKQAMTDRQRADHDRQIADLDRAKAEKDREVADKDRARAIIDRQRAEKDREQAERDRLQADLDRARAEKDREHFEAQRKQADEARIKVN